MKGRVDFSRKGLETLLKRLAALLRAERSSIVAAVMGCSIYTFGVMAFTVPYRFPDAGVTGIAILINYQFGISLPAVIAVANILLLVWAWRELSPRIMIWTIIGVGFITLLMHLMEGISIVDTDQKLLIALISGAIKGYGGALTLRQGLSMGGTDIVILYLQKKYGIELGKYSFYINMCVLGASTFVVGVENVMFGLVSLYASSVAIDNTITAFDKRRQVFVITRNPQVIVDYLITAMQSGATVIDAHGGYSREDRPIVMCILTRRQAVELRRFLAANHKDAFMVVADASEVVGRGFKAW